MSLFVIVIVTALIGLQDAGTQSIEEPRQREDEAVASQASASFGAPVVDEVVLVEDESTPFEAWWDSDDVQRVARDEQEHRREAQDVRRIVVERGRLGLERTRVTLLSGGVVSCERWASVSGRPEDLDTRAPRRALGRLRPDDVLRLGTWLLSLDVCPDKGGTFEKPGWHDESVALTLTYADGDVTRIGDHATTLAPLVEPWVVGLAVDGLLGRVHWVVADELPLADDTAEQGWEIEVLGERFSSYAARNSSWAPGGPGMRAGDRWRALCLDRLGRAELESRGILLDDDLVCRVAAEILAGACDDGLSRPLADVLVSEVTLFGALQAESGGRVVLDPDSLSGGLPVDALVAFFEDQEASGALRFTNGGRKAFYEALDPGARQLVPDGLLGPIAWPERAVGRVGERR